MVNRFVAIFLLLSLLAPLAVTIGILQHRKREVRHEVKERMLAGLSDQDLVQIKVHRKDAHRLLDWEHEGEFEYEGVMYDIVRRQSTPDSLVYWCWEDRAETRLNDDLQRAIAMGQEQDPAQKDQQSKFQSFLKSLWIMQGHVRWLVERFFSSSAKDQGPESLLSGAISSLLHPPRHH